MRKLLIDFYVKSTWDSEMEGVKFESREYKRIFETEIDGVKYYISENYRNYTKNEYYDPSTPMDENDEYAKFPVVNLYETNNANESTIDNLIEFLSDGNPIVIVEDNRA